MRFLFAIILVVLTVLSCRKDVKVLTCEEGRHDVITESIFLPITLEPFKQTFSQRGFIEAENNKTGEIIRYEFARELPGEPIQPDFYDDDEIMISRHETPDDKSKRWVFLVTGVNLLEINYPYQVPQERLNNDDPNAIIQFYEYKDGVYLYQYDGETQWKEVSVEFTSFQNNVLKGKFSGSIYPSNWTSSVILKNGSFEVSLTEVPQPAIFTGNNFIMGRREGFPAKLEIMPLKNVRSHTIIDGTRKVYHYVNEITFPDRFKEELFFEVPCHLDEFSYEGNEIFQTNITLIKTSRWITDTVNIVDGTVEVVKKEGNNYQFNLDVTTEVSGNDGKYFVRDRYYLAIDLFKRIEYQ